MSTPWLTIIGVSEGGIDALPPKTLELISQANTVFGAQRFLAQLPKNSTQITSPWSSPFSDMIEQIIAQRGARTIILASGDPNWFGIGSTLNRFLKPDEFEVISAPSAFQLAASLLHWPMQDVLTLSLHGRSVDHLSKHLFCGAKILALTSDKNTLNQVSERLKEMGFSSSIIHVLENLGSANQKVSVFPAKHAAEQNIGDYYVLAIECKADVNADICPVTIGLPDQFFEHDGQLTKRHVRAITLSSLAPCSGELLWDVGAGSGSIGIEWMRAAPRTKAICFEIDQKRCARIETNKVKLGVPDLEVICEDAKSAMLEHPAPDAIFIGGAVADNDLFDLCWKLLKPGGRLVCNAVTLSGNKALIERQIVFGGALSSIAISTQKTLGKNAVLQPNFEVLHWQVRKPTGLIT